MAKHSANTKIQNNARNNRGRNRKNNKKKKKIIITFLLLIIIIIGVVCGFVINKLNKIEYTTLDTSMLNLSDNVPDGYRNIALLAVDSRNVNSNNGSRTDGIIILSINEKTKEAKLASVYRDTYVEVEGHNLTKVTHAHAYGGPSLTIGTLNKNLDLNISEFATVNFEGVANIIDIMGGIEIDIKQEELKQMNKYIKDTSKNTGISSPQLSHAGRQKLNGVQAVTYGRIRKLAGGDYKRTERMRTVIMTAFDKAKTMDVGTLNRMVDEILPKVQTNINSTELLSLATQLSSYKITDSIGWPYEVKGKTLDAWYGVPVSLETNVKKLHEELFGQTEYEASESVKEISNKIVNKTGYRATDNTTSNNTTSNSTTSNTTRKK